MYYDDVRDHLIRVVDMIDTMRDYLAGSLDVYTARQTQRATQQTQRVNQSVQRLTVISTIFHTLNLYYRRLRDKLRVHTGGRVALRLLRHRGALRGARSKYALLPAPQRYVLGALTSRPYRFHSSRGLWELRSSSTRSRQARLVA